MTDKYTDDLGSDITCQNCSVTAREFFQEVLRDEPAEIWMVGSTWYCSVGCYEEATKDEG